jgi:hypothetical protein
VSNLEEAATAATAAAAIPGSKQKLKREIQI